MALQWRQIWVIFYRDALNCEGTIVNITVSVGERRERRVARWPHGAAATGRAGRRHCASLFDLGGIADIEGQPERVADPQHDPTRGVEAGAIGDHLLRKDGDRIDRP